MTVFHGSYIVFSMVSLVFSKVRRDFGRGFYTTKIREQAEEWLRFIIRNRKQGGIQHDYEVVQGPVANDKIFPTIALFLNGRYDVEYTLNQLSFFRPNDQLSVHSEKALCNLSLVDKRSWKP
jgi:hypothetical protein